MWRSDPFRSMQVWRWASNLGMVPGAEGIQNRKQRIAKIEFNSNPPRLEVSKIQGLLFHWPVFTPEMPGFPLSAGKSGSRILFSRVPPLPYNHCLFLNPPGGNHAIEVRGGFGFGLDASGRMREAGNERAGQNRSF